MGQKKPLMIPGLPDTSSCTFMDFPKYILSEIKGSGGHGWMEVCVFS